MSTPPFESLRTLEEASRQFEKICLVVKKNAPEPAFVIVINRYKLYGLKIFKKTRKYLINNIECGTIALQRIHNLRCMYFV